MRGADPRYLAVELAHVSLRRGGRRVLTDLKLCIRPGERWVLAGANGAGKTQLLKLLAGSVWPEPKAQSVRRYVRGRHEWLTPHDVKQDIAYLGAERQDKYQRYGWDMSVERIVGTGIHRTDIPLDALSRADRRQVRRALRALRAGHLAARPFLSLSYGERRVALLARALASRPRLLLLDEVLNGLDAENRTRVLEWLERRKRRLPWVLATHRLEDVPRAASRALVLERGRIVYAGARRRAPLTRWLAPHAHPRLARRARARPAAPGKQLVRLHNARVYLDGSRALSGISLAVRAGECWVVHGRNGSGKTTLLRTLYGDHGVAVGGRIERAGIAPGVPLEHFKRRVGLVAPHLQADHPRELTVCEVVQSGRHASVGLNGAPSSADRAATRRVLAHLGLTRLARRRLRELSYGQSRRVLFARALVRSPQLLLLDEPLAGVDAPTRAALLQRVAARTAAGAAVVVTAHRLGDWPGEATHELELAAGRARYCGPLRQRPLARRGPLSRRAVRAS
ncbi:MAG TPA: ATP-binding cassette domain-containing protein [Steroidobacteraceae bacterium]|jgi:molybdate transport system ATP-binding protein|nr:ATP-binding cassette domain-containing protein [Steroidobacteraceae bacterium]